MFKEKPAMNTNATQHDNLSLEGQDLCKFWGGHHSLLVIPAFRKHGGDP